MNFIVGIFVGILVFGSVSMAFPKYTVLYRQGQVDALTGNVKFHLVDKPDGTKVWERK
mgnify:CR=1 FL=1|jgi:hypothetical protein